LTHAVGSLPEMVLNEINIVIAHQQGRDCLRSVHITYSSVFLLLLANLGLQHFVDRFCCPADLIHAQFLGGIHL
jgi:hypothetical protein